MKAVFALLALLVVSSVSSAQYQSSTSCSAYTACLDNYGRPYKQISCAVLGYQTVMNYGFQANNNCTWFVQPYRAIGCSGYQQTFDMYGNVYYQWQNFYVTCSGY